MAKLGQRASLSWVLLTAAIAGCADAGDRDANIIEVPGSSVRVARIDQASYSVSFDGDRFSAPRQAGYAIALRTAQFDPAIEAPRQVAGFDDVRSDAAADDLYLVQFFTPPLDAYRDHLAELGAAAHGVLPGNTVITRMDAGTARAVASQRYVRWVGRYLPSWRIDSTVRAQPSGLVDVWLRAISERDRPDLAAQVQALGGQVQAASATGPLLRAQLDARALPALTALPTLEFIDRYSAPEADMDLARQLSGAVEIETVYGFRGEGVRAEVMDGDFLTSHVDFASRPLIQHGPEAASDPFHGTATAGIVFGDGTGDAKGRGVLPMGQGIIASYETVTDRYAHTAELLTEPYQAVFQSNSWGGGRTTDYTTVSAELDRIAFDHDLLILQSQSNAGTRASRPEAWSKNVLSIGAFNHKDSLSPDDDRWERTASIGPAADGRIKPDLAHFYDATHAPSSSGGYGDFGGTSGATPITAGHAGLFYQMWSEGVFGTPGPGDTVFARRPHMTLAKAMLINTAWAYPFEGPSHDMTRTHQGWGRVDLTRAHTLAGRMLWVNETDVLAPLATATYHVEVAADEPTLRATLVYADPPGTPAAARARINDLTLRVVSPSGLEYFGNAGLGDGNQSIAGGMPDLINTVENVWLTAPEPGTWRIEVRADEVVVDGHRETEAMDADFALVVTGVADSGGGGGDPSPGPGHVLIAQVGYDTPGDDALEEFVELYNPTAAAVDLSGWRLQDGVGAWTVPAGTVIAPGTSLWIGRDTAGVTGWLGQAPSIAGLTLALGNSGDALSLQDATGVTVDALAWESTSLGWPVATATGGTLVRTALTDDTDTVADWAPAPAPVTTR